MELNTKSLVPYSASAVAGFTICFTIASITGKREAWDSPMYFTSGIPLMCIVIFIVAYLNPEKPWRWTMAMAVGQGAAMAIHGGSLSLWPLSIIAMTVCSVPQFVIGAVASWIKSRVRK